MKEKENKEQERGQRKGGKRREEEKGKMGPTVVIINKPANVHKRSLNTGSCLFGSMA